MAYVITQKCAGTCDTACVQVCPVDCIHGPVDPEQLRSLDPAARAQTVVRLQLFIDPNECIHCGMCVAECPVDAIYSEDAVPERWKADIAANADYFKRPR